MGTEGAVTRCVGRGLGLAVWTASSESRMCLVPVHEGQRRVGRSRLLTAPPLSPAGGRRVQSSVCGRRAQVLAGRTRRPGVAVAEGSGSSERRRRRVVAAVAARATCIDGLLTGGRLPSATAGRGHERCADPSSGGRSERRDSVPADEVFLVGSTARIASSIDTTRSPGRPPPLRRRRSRSAPSGQQSTPLCALAPAESSRTSPWHALRLRGPCSAPPTLRAASVFLGSGPLHCSRAREAFVQRAARPEIRFATAHAARATRTV